MEARSNQETLVGQPVVGNPRGAFDAFQAGLKKGFGTHEQELAAYGGMLRSFDVYFHQPGIEASPQTSDLVTKLFFHQRETADVPIEFFTDARDLLNKKRNGRGYASLEQRRRDEFTLLGDLTRGALEKATISLNLERRDRQKLERLAASSQELGEGTEPLNIQFGNREERMRQVRQVTVDYLSADPEFAEDIAQRNRFIVTLEELLQEESWDPNSLKDRLADFGEFVAKKDGGSYADELYLRALAGQNRRIGETLSGLKEQASQSEFLWRMWVENGDVPADLINSFEEVITLAEVADTAELLGDAPASVKARYLLPYIKRGVSLGLLTEIVDGKYEFPPDFVAKQIDAFAHFFDAYEDFEKAKVPWTTRRKIAATVLAGMIIVSPFILKEFRSPTNMPQSVAEILQQIPGQELSDLGIQAGVRDGASERSTANTLGRPDSIRPDNSSLEDFEKARNQKVWVLEGNSSQFAGFYRQETASVFDPQTQAWKAGESIAVSNPVSASKGVVTMKSVDAVIANGIVSIPVKDGFAPVFTNGTRTVAGTTSAMISHDKVFTFPMPFQDENGIYYLLPDKDSLGQSVEISIVIGKAGNVEPAPSAAELLNMQAKLIGIDSLPPDVRKLVDDLNARSNLSKVQKARVLEKFVQTNFLYSLKPQWSNYYHDTSDGQEFIRRILEVKKADCDVANTALVALLRQQGIAARMVFGFANTGPLDKNSAELTGTEAHGWVEAYIDGKWLTLDGTPTRPEDKETADALKNSGSGGKDEIAVGNQEEDGNSSSFGGGSDAGGADNGNSNSSGGDANAVGVNGKGGKFNSGIKPGDQGGKVNLEAGSEQGEKGSGSGRSASSEASGGSILDIDQGGDFVKDLQSLKNWVKESKVAQALLIAEAINLLAVGTRPAHRRRSVKLAGKLREQVTSRAGRYFGPEFKQLAERAITEETAEININTGFRSNPFLLLAPFGILAVAADTKRYENLEKLPYNPENEAPNVEQATAPSMYDFLTEALGYGENEVKRDLLGDSYRETVRQLRVAADSRLQLLLYGNENIHESDYISRRFINKVDKKIDSFSEPSSREEWEATKRQIFDSLYAGYIAERAKKIKKLGKGKEPEPGLSKEQFVGGMEEVLGYVVVEWQVQREFDAAMKSLA